MAARQFNPTKGDAEFLACASVMVLAMSAAATFGVLLGWVAPVVLGVLTLVVYATALHAARRT